MTETTPWYRKFLLHNQVIQYHSLQGSTDSVENLIHSGENYGIEVKDFNTGSRSKISVITFKNVAVTDTGDYTCKWDTTSFDPKATMTVAVRCEYEKFRDKIESETKLV